MAKQAVGQWRHVFKLDPEREIADAALECLCESGTDAVIVGGSSGVTYDNTEELLIRIRRYSLPCALEVSTMEAIVPGFDLYLVPMVLNTTNIDWLIGYQQEAIKQYGSSLPWERVMAEGYVILNPDSTAAKVANAQTTLTKDDLQAYARLSEHLLQLPILYVEYSGTFGDMDLLAATAKTLKQTRLFYGGGIDCLERAQQAAAWADTIIVGNIIYENMEQALETVHIKKAKKGNDHYARND